MHFITENENCCDNNNASLSERFEIDAEIQEDWIDDIINNIEVQNEPENVLDNSMYKENMYYFPEIILNLQILVPAVVMLTANSI